MTSATAIICYPPLSLGPSPSSQQSHYANIFEHGILIAISIGYSQKRDFANITVIIRV